MEIRTVGIVDAGQMGSGIAHVATPPGTSDLPAEIDSEDLGRGFFNDEG